MLLLTTHLVESTRGPIEGLVKAQDAYFAEHSRYAHSLEDLVDFGVPEDAMLEFSSTSAGWSAATPGGDVAYRCFAQHTAAGSRAVWCEHGAKGDRVMREWYEAL